MCFRNSASSCCILKRYLQNNVDKKGELEYKFLADYRCNEFLPSKPKLQPVTIYTSPEIPENTFCGESVFIQSHFPQKIAG